MGMDMGETASMLESACAGWAVAQIRAARPAHPRGRLHIGRMITSSHDHGGTVIVLEESITQVTVRELRARLFLILFELDTNSLAHLHHGSTHRKSGKGLSHRCYYTRNCHLCLLPIRYFCPDHTARAGASRRQRGNLTLQGSWSCAPSSKARLRRGAAPSSSIKPQYVDAT